MDLNNNNMELQERIIFYHAFYQTMLSDINNAQLIREAEFLKSTTETNVLSNYGGWQSRSMSNNDLITLSETQKLKNQVLDIFYKIYQTWNFNFAPKFDNLWFNINGKKDFNHQHIHPKSIFSCVYYVKVPKNSGKFIFVREDAQNYMIPDFYNEYTHKRYQIEPTENLLILFPSYIQHSVLPNESDEERISIAMNFTKE